MPSQGTVLAAGVGIAALGTIGYIGYNAYQSVKEKTNESQEPYESRRKMTAYTPRSATM